MGFNDVTQGLSVDDIFFMFCYAIVTLAWVALILGPTWKITMYFIRSVAVTLLLSLMYFFFVVARVSKLHGGYFSLDAVYELQQNKEFTLVGWIHYLAFDLFVGSWMVMNSRSEGIPHAIVIPCLLCTVFIGPIGFLLYWAVRIIIRKEILMPFEVFEEGASLSNMWFGDKEFWRSVCTWKRRSVKKNTPSAYMRRLEEQDT